MRITSIEKLMNSVDDGELLDIYTELESGKVPSTSYAHDFCRKVNRMIDDGELSVKQDGFRHIYLPSLRKLVFKEMARRYAAVLQYTKPTPGYVYESAQDGAADGEVCRCAWCNGEYDNSDLRVTDLGMLCDQCIEAIRSRGEDVAVLI